LPLFRNLFSPLPFIRGRGIKGDGVLQITKEVGTQGEGYIKTTALDTIEELEVQGEWYKNIVKAISLYKDSLSENEYKKYKLDLLLRIVKRVDGFSAICGECQLFQPEITGLVQYIGNLARIPDKEARKRHFKAVDTFTKHLQKQHKLVTKWQYLSMWSGIGAGIGIAFGAALDNSGIGTAIGTVVGVLIGLAMDAKAKREGRII